MSIPAKSFDVDRIREVIGYDACSGKFVWIKRPSCRSAVREGDSAGTVSKSGYVVIRIGRRAYQAHRLAWALHYGIVPMQIIDHINGVKADNRISNLRIVSISENLQNQYKAGARNSTGFLGVSVFKNKYVATINVQGKNKYLGQFDKAEDAAAAYQEAKRVFHIPQAIQMDEMGIAA